MLIIQIGLALAAQIGNPVHCQSSGACDIVVVHNQLERRALTSEVTCGGVEFIMRTSNPPDDLLSGVRMVLIINAIGMPEATLAPLRERYDMSPGDARLTGCSEQVGEARGHARYIGPNWEGVRTIEFAISRTGTFRIEDEFTTAPSR